MSSNVGLSTPRGSGTSGYVQRNLAHLRPRDQVKPYPDSELRHKQRQPDKAILEHDRKREIEVKVFELRDKLEEEGVDEEEIETQTEQLRKKLTAESERGGAGGRAPPRKGLKMHQVHELADAKIKQDNRFRNALGIKKDYEEGGHWKRQEERVRERAEKEAKQEQERAGRDD